MLQAENKPYGWVNALSNGLRKIEVIMGTISGVLIIILMLLIDVTVSGRYLFNKPLPLSYELAILVLVVIMMIGQPWVQSIRGHLGMEFILERVSARKAAIIRIFGLVIVMAILFLLAWQGARFASRNMDMVFFGIVEVPVWPALVAVPIGFGIACFRIPFQIYEEIANFRNLSRQRSL
jgi:TRAP-type C4-dicarboxylate transport system permease small subunit